MLSKNTYSMFPHGGSPSSHPRTSTAASLLGLNGNELFLHHHDMLSGHHLLYSQDVGGLNGNGDPSATAFHSPKPSKKDRHSKINTAQGPRDRRVRLSIGVARKFFDLQESLGFDKPSKTLDWLLTKSETAINDVELMREKASTDAECEVDDSGEDLKQNNNNNNNKIKGSVKDSTKESRMKARARARERTREKMSIKNKLNEYSCRNNNGGGHGCDNFSPIQFINKISSSGNSSVGFLHHQSYEAAATEAARNEDLIEESIVIKRKVKHSLPSMLGFQQNLIISSSNYGVVPNPYNNNNNNNNNAAAAENWDNICAILDHHKFINSTSNN